MVTDPQLIEALAGLQLRLQQLENHAAATAVGPKVKPPKPELFHGNTQDTPKVRQWIFQTENFFTITGVEDPYRVPYTATLLRDNALLWWQSLKLEERPNSWDSFFKQLLVYFQPLSAVYVARERLARCSQRTTVKAYIEEFKSLALNIEGLTEMEKMDRFRRGLNPEVRLQVTFAMPGTFEIMVQVAEQLDEILHENRKATPTKQWWPKKPWTPYRSMTKTNGPSPMELGAIQSYSGAVRGTKPNIRAPLTPETREECRRAGTCFYCRQPGHMMARCPSKPKENAMRRK